MIITTATLGDHQDEVAAWHEREFPGALPEWLGLIVAEEAGEVARAMLKLMSNVRGGRDVWYPELKAETADVLIALLALANRMGFDLEEAYRERWAVVSKRRFATAEAHP